MDNNAKLVYVALGALMLVMLQLNVFQDSIGFANVIGIHYLGEVMFQLSNILSFVGVILFVVIAFKLIIKNIRR